MLSDGGRDAATNLSCINYAHQAKVDLRDHRLIIIIINNRPKPVYGRQGLAGLWGQVTDQAGTFWSVLNREKPGVGHLPGGHLQPPKFGHWTPPNSDIHHHPKTVHLPGGQLPPPVFFLFLLHFSWLFRLTAHGGHQGWDGGGA